MEKANETPATEVEATSAANKLSIKKEAINDDIKEFAETAMNELLGWYGYGRDPPPNSNAPRNCHSHSGSNSSGPESPKFNDGCGWCGKPVDESTALSSSAATFCSELCFSQSRRANFKKNKTCDWCRHVRHTVSYVDTQDGASQLQFCSDKCLNQYKMHIFWRETRAHLDIHPHLHAEESSSSGTLITPELWMNKCKSPPLPASSSSPPSSLSPKLGETPQQQQTSPLPLITVAHPSKLLMPSSFSAQAAPKRHVKKFPQQNKRVVKKKIGHASSSLSCSPKSFYADMPQDLRVRHSSNSPNLDRLQLMEAPEVAVDKSRPSVNYNYFAGGESATTTAASTTLARKLLEGLVPPPTVLVPYPIIIPLPVPIPIPIPMPIPNHVYYKFSNNDKEKFKDVSSQTLMEVESEDEAKTTEVTVCCEKKGAQGGRPLRKRKTKLQPKAKIFKNKRLISA